MKLTKKQIGIAAAVVIVLVGCGATAGVVSHNNAVQAKQVQEQKAKDAKIKAEKKAESNAKKAIEEAQKVPTDKNIKLASDSVEKVTDKKVKDSLIKEIAGINSRVKIENTAKIAVSAFQKNNSNSDKQKTAQNAVNALTSSYSKALKTDLQNKINASIKAHTDAEVKAKADQEAQAKKKDDVQAQANQQTQDNNTAQVSEPQVTQGSQVPAQDNNNYYSQSQAATGQASAPNYSAPAAHTNANGTPTLDQANKDVADAGSVGTGNANNKQPGEKW